MKKQEISWIPDGWTVIQEADAAKHILEISCFAEKGVVTEVRKRHNDGEEEKLTKRLDETHSLPMALADFKAAVAKKEILFK